MMFVLIKSHPFLPWPFGSRAKLTRVPSFESLHSGGGYLCYGHRVWHDREHRVRRAHGEDPRYYREHRVWHDQVHRAKRAHREDPRYLYYGHRVWHDQVHLTEIVLGALTGKSC